MARPILLIGYGNPLRSDDGAGVALARDAQGWGPPQLRVLAVHQLTPDLAQDLAEVDCVIFADACTETDELPRLEPIYPHASDAPMSHSSTPEELLAITSKLYGQQPEAYALKLPAVTFEVGETLSEQAQVGVQLGSHLLEDLFDRVR